jgi:hypothetical protein
VIFWICEGHGITDLDKDFEQTLASEGCTGFPKDRCLMIDRSVRP